MNVYGKGGFFSAHVDTPVDAALMIGTVVVCLPSKHTGGVLKVQHKGIKEEFKFADLSGDGGKIQWAAFYSDCVHEILPVQEGHRITVTYNILQELSFDYSYPGTCKSDSFSEGQVVTATKPVILDKIVADISKLSTDKQVFLSGDGSLERFGIFLRHKYTMSALALGHLKGCDQVLYTGLISRGLTCQLQTVLVNDQGPEPPHASWKQMRFIKEWSKETVLIERSNKQGRNCGNITEPGQTDRLYLQSVIIIKLPMSAPKTKNTKSSADKTDFLAQGQVLVLTPVLFLKF
ncbi:uncharacterized protein LOC117307227 [Asterias rubens]|uniref:uncharacterized protein LOC117307227 n=1 Tax=Asterias rubens TaxID=7604 RepID=UPI0014556A7F|nr:uncharacterized protein LOC117307227 [Asterias rubens]